MSRGVKGVIVLHSFIYTSVSEVTKRKGVKGVSLLHSLNKYFMQ
jgi:hypothetical protein